jgi:hypothetical protein
MNDLLKTPSARLITGFVLVAALAILGACSSPVGSRASGKSTDEDGLASFVQAVDSVTPPDSDSSAVEIYTYAITVETLAGVYDILPADVAGVVTDQIAVEPVRLKVLGVLDGSLTLIDLMVADTGAYQDEEQGIVVGLPLREEIPADSPIQASGTPEIVDDGDRVGMEFDAEEDYLIIPADPTNDLTHEGTIALWLKPEVNVAWAGIIHKGTQSDWSDEGYSLQYDESNQLMLAMTSEAGQTILVRTHHVLATGEWSHLVATWDADEVHIYVNGADVVDGITVGFSSTETTIAENYPFRSSGGDVVVGTQIPGNPWRFDGVMSDIRIYDRYMEQSEVLDDFNG